MRPPRFSIKRRLIVTQMMVASAVLLLFSVFHVVSNVQAHRDSVRVRLAAMARIIGYNCTSALDFKDPEDAAKTLASLESEQQVSYAWILDSHSRVFATYRRPGQAPRAPELTAEDAELLEGPHLTLSRRILQDDKVIGAVVLRYDLDRFWPTLLRYYAVAVPALAAGLAIALLLSILAQRSLSGPILGLVDTVRRITHSHDLSMRMPETRSDEIGVLYRGFNSMLGEIQAREVERDQALADLQESEAKYRTLVENANDGIVIIQDGRFVYANPSAVAMSGRRSDELIGKVFTDYVAPEEVFRVTRRYERRLAGREEASMYETVFQGLNGERIHAEVNAALIHYRAKPAELVIIRNVNERRKAEDEIRTLNQTLERRVEERTRDLETANARLIELDRLKSIFLASMSHELRTPLNSILGFTGLMLMGMAGPLNEEQTKQLNLVRGGATHLLDLINDILDISKIESGKVDLEIEPFTLPEVVNDVITALEPLAHAKGLELAVQSPFDVVVESDRRRIKQVLMNLVGNSIKFSPSGTVRVDVEVKLGEVDLHVTDSGIGIRAEDQAKLFNPFQQVDMTSTKQFEGTGLGLYLCKKILDLLHGRISVRSELGHGSTFTFTIPLEWKGASRGQGADHRG